MEKKYVAPVSFGWADNPIKLHQAEEYIRNHVPEIVFDESNIKARYIELGGKVNRTVKKSKKGKVRALVEKLIG